MDNRTIYYALSVFMKNGDVLHLEGLTREEKDRYFTLARNPEQSLLIEEDNRVRNLLGADIASVSFKRYTMAYEKGLFQVEKMFMSESFFGKAVYFTIMKVFFLFAIILMIKETAMTLFQGDIATTLFDVDAIGRVFTESLAATNTLFRYAYVIMLAISLIDIVLGLISNYHINQDGAPEVSVRRYTGLLITIVFIIAISLIKSILLKV